MPSKVPYKIKQFFFVLIKLSIVVGAFYFIYSKITKNEYIEFSEFISLLKENNTFLAKTISFLILLSCFNWFLEILKWQQLVNVIKQISFKSAAEQSLGALTASLITPNRIGDYGAKAMYYTSTFRKKILGLNLIGNLAQMTITTFFGTIGLFLFIKRYSIDIDYLRVAQFGAIIFLCGVIIWFFIKQKWFKIKGFSFASLLDFTNSIPLKVHGLNLMLSLFRYVVFSFQFYYLLHVFGVNISYSDAMILISSMYLLASIIPTISIFDVVIKGSIAVFLFGYIEINELTILSITTLMWLLNFVIPSIIGSYFVLNFKLPKPIEQC